MVVGSDRISPAFMRRLCCYASLSPASKRKKSHDPDMSFWDLDTLLLHLLDDPHFRAYPPSRDYQKLWWKLCLRDLEAFVQAGDDDVEIDSRIYEHYTSLLGPDSQLAPLGVLAPDIPQPSFVTYLVPKPLRDPDDDVHFRVTTRESRTIVESGTTGLHTWKASLVMAEFLTFHSDLVKGRRVLELGSGSGFLGAVVAALQLECDKQEPSNNGSIHLTDGNADVLQRCRDNIRLPCNASSQHKYIHTHELDWFECTTFSRSGGTPSTTASLIDSIQPEVVLGTDIVYDPSIIDPLIATLRLALESRKPGPPSEAYLACAIRNESTTAAFMEKARANFTVEDVQWDRPSFLDRQLEEPITSDIKIVRLSVLNGIVP